MVYPFSEEEYKKGILALKNGKAAGIDAVLIEQLKNIGTESHKWLHATLNKCFTEHVIPREYHGSPQTWEGFCDIEVLQTNIPLMAHVQTTLTTHPQQNSAHA